MKKVGEILRTQRIKQDLTLDDVSSETKIKVEYLRYIELGEYNKLPDPVYIQGFIRSYAQAVGLNPDKVIPFYRRESMQAVQGGKSVKRIPSILPKNRLQLTPGKLVTIIISVALTAFIAVLFIQYQMFAGAPVLIVDSPMDNMKTSLEYVQIYGKTDKDAKLQINGEDVTVDSEGEFSLNFKLDEGLNRIRIVSTSKLGKKTIVERVVDRTKPEPKE